MGQQLLYFVMHALVVVFALGMLGSSVVVVISFIEDMGELLGDE